MPEPYEHPALGELIREVEKYADGQPIPNPFVIPKRLYRTIALAAHEGKAIKRTDKIELMVPIAGQQVRLQPEGNLSTRVEWQWLLEGQAIERRRLLR